MILVFSARVKFEQYIDSQFANPEQEEVCYEKDCQASNDLSSD